MATYQTILLDPPWPFRVWSKATGNGRSAESHYRTMEWKDLWDMGAALHAVADRNCALFMWACRPSIPQALDMVERWNENKPKAQRWVYKTEAFTWVKRTAYGKPATGMGYWTRANTEPVLLFTRGTVKRLAKDVPQVVETFGRMPHSAKPEIVQDRIERLVSGPYLECFARRHRPGWECLGNELNGLDICESLQRLVSVREAA